MCLQLQRKKISKLGLNICKNDFTWQRRGMCLFHGSANLYHQFMLSDLASLGPLPIAAALVVGCVAGVVKGTTGFGVPMIFVSGLGSFLAPDIALAGLILPALATNLLQALRQGARAAVDSAWTHRIYLSMVMIFILLSSQLVLSIPSAALYLILGFTVTLFTMLQLAGWQPKIAPNHRRQAEFGIGGFAGILGGLTGTWGPPTVMYLAALDTPKLEHVRVQGVIYGAGAVVLTLAHLRSGVLTGTGLSLSLFLILPTFLGMAAGLAVQDRLDQDRFRLVVLIALTIAGLNLIRRALFG